MKSWRAESDAAQLASLGRHRLSHAFSKLSSGPRVPEHSASPLGAAPAAGKDRGGMLYRRLVSWQRTAVVYGGVMGPARAPPIKSDSVIDQAQEQQGLSNLGNSQKRPRQWPPIEPVLPREMKRTPAGVPRPTGLSDYEPEFRSLWIILAVILFLALTAGGCYYWLNRPERVPLAAEIAPALIVPTPNSDPEPVLARGDTPSVSQTPPLVTGLWLSSRQPASAPDTPQPAASEPDEPPSQLAVGLRPKIEQEQSPAATPPTAGAPPSEPPSAAIPNAKPSRNAAHHGSSLPSPRQSSPGPVRF
jgi:hypothetical protein